MNKTLTNKQIAFAVFSCIVGYGVISLPKDIAKDFGTSGWLLIIIGDIIVFLYASIYIYLAKTFNNKTIYDYSKILTGKFITCVIILIISIYSISTASIVTRLSSETIKLSFLMNTPSWALCAFMTLVVFYTLINDLNVLGRVFEIFSIVIIISALLLQVGVITKGNFTNIKPIFAFGELNLSLKTLINILFPFLGIEILSVIPMDIKKQNKNVLRYVSIMIVFIGMLYIITVESCISVMGVKSITHYEDAVLATIRRIEIDALQFLKRLDSIFIIAWLLAIYTTVVSTLYIAIFLISSLLTKINRNIIVMLVMITTYIVGLIPKTMDSLKSILTSISYLGVIVLFIIPLVLFILTLIKKHYNKLS